MGPNVGNETQNQAGFMWLSLPASIPQDCVCDTCFLDNLMKDTCRPKHVFYFTQQPTFSVICLLALYASHSCGCSHEPVLLLAFLFPFLGCWFSFLHVQLHVHVHLSLVPVHWRIFCRALYAAFIILLSMIWISYWQQKFNPFCCCFIHFIALSR